MGQLFSFNVSISGSTCGRMQGGELYFVLIWIDLLTALRI